MKIVPSSSGRATSIRIQDRRAASNHLLQWPEWRLKLKNNCDEIDNHGRVREAQRSLNFINFCNKASIYDVFLSNLKGFLQERYFLSWNHAKIVLIILWISSRYLWNVCDILLCTPNGMKGRTWWYVNISVRSKLTRSHWCKFAFYVFLVQLQFKVIPIMRLSRLHTVINLQWLPLPDI